MNESFAWKFFQEFTYGANENGLWLKLTLIILIPFHSIFKL